MPDAIQDDGLCTEKIGHHSKKKHELIRHYAEIFATGMKNQWANRAYVDLFAGPGMCRVKGTDELVCGSPLLVLDIKDPFDRYVFCESEEQKIDALRARVASQHGGLDVRFVHGDSNAKTDDILAALPDASRESKCLAFFLVDPYRIENLAFATIERLSERYGDFLILIPTGMDIARNEHVYAQPGDNRLDRFLGDASWRSEWEQQNDRSGAAFARFVADAFDKQMAQIGFRYGGRPEAETIRLEAKNVALYRLAFYSRHPRGSDFWNKARKASRSQQMLFDL